MQTRGRNTDHRHHRNKEEKEKGSGIELLIRDCGSLPSYPYVSLLILYICVCVCVCACVRVCVCVCGPFLLIFGDFIMFVILDSIWSLVS